MQSDWRELFLVFCIKIMYPCVHFVNAIPISLICLFSSVKNYIALSLSLSYTSRVMAFKGISKCFFSSLGGNEKEPKVRVGIKFRKSLIKLKQAYAAHDLKLVHRNEGLKQLQSIKDTPPDLHKSGINCRHLNFALLYRRFNRSKW